MKILEQSPKMAVFASVVPFWLKTTSITERGARALDLFIVEVLKEVQNMQMSGDLCVTQ